MPIPLGRYGRQCNKRASLSGSRTKPRIGSPCLEEHDLTGGCQATHSAGGQMFYLATLAMASSLTLVASAKRHIKKVGPLDTTAAEPRPRDPHPLLTDKCVATGAFVVVASSSSPHPLHRRVLRNSSTFSSAQVCYVVSSQLGRGRVRSCPIGSANVAKWATFIVS